MSKSWEEYVTDVCVFGRPGRQRDLAGEWEVLFRNASTVASALRDGIRDLEKTFVGPAGDAYRGHLMSIVTQIEKIDADNHQVVHMLEASADSLEVAQGMMPIPDTMLDDVEGHRAELDAANRAGAAGLTAGSAVLTGGMTLAPGMFFHDAISRSGVGDVGRETLGWFYDKVQNWHDDKTRDAVKAFTAANDGGHRAVGMAGDPKAGARIEHGRSDHFTPDTGAAPSTGAGGVPHIGAGGFKSPSSGVGSAVSGYDPAHGGGFTPGGGAYDSGATKPWDDSGLAGAGDGGFDGAGGSGLGGGGKGGPFGGGAGSLGAGGFGGGGFGGGGFGGGAGGFGAGGGMGAGGGGIGGIGSRIGTPVGAPGLTPPGGGRGAGGAGMMGAPMGGAHGGAGGGDERSTWLEEDEDVWGINDAGAPPNLLGR